MRLSVLSIASGAFLTGNVGVMLVNGFSVPAAPTSVGRKSLCQLAAADAGSSPSRTKPMSPEEIKARMGLPDDDEEPPKLFSDSLYDDMQQALLTLEKRIKEGPGSLSMLEVEELIGQTQRIVVEMRDFEAGRVSGLGTAQIPAAAPPQPVMEVVKSNVVTDTSDDEGPAYDGKGMGVPKGTRNTYVIPGMEEMSPEEYQAALNESILARQRERQSLGGYGNRATWDYLNNLTGEKGVLKRDDDGERP